MTALPSWATAQLTLRWAGRCATRTRPPRLSTCAMWRAWAKSSPPSRKVGSSLWCYDVIAMSTLARDLRYALRAFLKSPGFTAAAILSLAIGIGANTAIFSITSALLLRPLPYKDAGRLVILWNTSPGLGITQDWFSTAQYFDIKTGHQG